VSCEAHCAQFGKVSAGEVHHGGKPLMQTRLSIIDSGGEAKHGRFVGDGTGSLAAN
jgi:hypothetical protein